MRHLKNYFKFIRIHPVTFIYFLLAWMGGYLKWYLSTLLIVCIHEICHLMMAYYFHFKIDKVEILPFGAYLSLSDFYFRPIIQELCVVIVGPCSHLFMFFFIKCFTSGVYQDYLVQMNMWVFMFNLIPIYPMDGNRFICLILQSFIDLKDAFYLSLKISVFSFCVFTLFYFQTNTFIILSYLFIQQFYFMKFIPKYLRRYYTRLSAHDHNKKNKLHKQSKYRRGYNNYYLVNEQVYNEKEMIYTLLKEVKK